MKVSQSILVRPKVWHGFCGETLQFWIRTAFRIGHKERNRFKVSIRLGGDISIVEILPAQFFHRFVRLTMGVIKHSWKFDVELTGPNCHFQRVIRITMFLNHALSKAYDIRIFRLLQRETTGIHLEQPANRGLFNKINC